MKNTLPTHVFNDSVFKSQTLFKHLNKEELEELFDKENWAVRKRGEVIYNEGNHITGFYYVISGIVKIHKTGNEGKEQILKFAKKGDIIGYRSALSGDLACSTAKIIADTNLCYMQPKVIDKLIASNFKFTRSLLEFICKELGEANDFITDIAQKTVRERLAEVLLHLKDNFGVDSDNVLQISLIREELANMVGTATESVIRLLSEFNNDKLIELQKSRKIKLLDIPGLKRRGNIY